MTANTATETWAPRMLSVLRIMTGLLFFFHGAQKLLEFPVASERGVPELFSLIWFSGALELVGGPLIVLGLFTRPVAFILAGHMAFAYFMAHHGFDATKLSLWAPLFGEGFYPVVNRGDGAILYCFIFLYLFVAGGGAWSLDRLLGRDHARVEEA